MSEIRGASVSQQRYQAVLFLSLAVLAILLAALGVYRLIAQSVAERTREMGIRLALGTTSRGAVAAISSILPALRLSRLDPVQTLRQD